MVLTNLQKKPLGVESIVNKITILLVRKAASENKKENCKT
jgi:hypothetical protein